MAKVSKWSENRFGRVKWCLHSSIDRDLHPVVLIWQTDSYSEMLPAVSLVSAYCVSRNLRPDLYLPGWNHILRETKIRVVNLFSEQLFFLFLLLIVLHVNWLDGYLRMMTWSIVYIPIVLNRKYCRTNRRHLLSHQIRKIASSKKRKNNCAKERFTTVIFVSRKTWSHLGRQKSGRRLVDTE
jgi:hypothetical protein